MSSLPASTAIPSIGGVGLLDADDPVDLPQLGQQVGPHVDRRAAGDVVDQHRRAVGRARDLLEVAHDPAPVRLVVVRRDREHDLGAGGDHALRQLDGVAGVVGASARDDRAVGADLLHDQLDEADLLVVGQRRRLTGRARHDEAVGAVRQQMAGNRHGRVVVDAAVGMERRDHGRQQSFVRAHGAQFRTPPRRGDVRRGRQPASGSPLESFGGA
jgi:hypothetical protein